MVPAFLQVVFPLVGCAHYILWGRAMRKVIVYGVVLCLCVPCFTASSDKAAQVPSVQKEMADPVEGIWKSVDDNTGKPTGVWRLYVQDGKLFGKILVCMGRAPNAAVVSCTRTYPDFPKKGNVANMPLVGTPFIYNLERTSPGSWGGGYVIDPASGKYYYCKINFIPADGRSYKVDTLQMRGEISWGIGRSQYWLRSSQTEVDEDRKSVV